MRGGRIFHCPQKKRRFRAGLAEQILGIHDKEKEAIEALRNVMSV
jgi:hypothetical protein